MKSKYHADKPIVATRMIIDQVRQITHPNINTLDRAALTMLDLQEIEDSIIGNRQATATTAPADLFQAAIRWADRELIAHAAQQQAA